jgi:hypothetical protein
MKKYIMKKKIIFDVDGVVRNLGIIHEQFKIPRATEWCWKYKGLDIYGWVKKDYSVLVRAEPTKYVDVVKEFQNGNTLEFWSYQPEDWRPYTLQWLKKHFGNKFIIRYLKPLEKFARLQKYKNVILVEDYPMFPNYNRIALINRYYNKDSKASLRIKTLKDLTRLLYENKKL